MDDALRGAPGPFPADLAAMALGVICPNPDSDLVEKLITLLLQLCPHCSSEEGGDGTPGSRRARLLPWVLADTLGVMNPLVVRRALVKQLTLKPLHDHPPLIYLISVIQPPEPQVTRFLDHCLRYSTDTMALIHTIRALGWIYARKYRKTFEQIAAGRDGDTARQPGRPLGGWKGSDKDWRRLRLNAMEALGRIGDKQTLTNLRKGRHNWDLRLERTYYALVEEIGWRRT